MTTKRKKIYTLLMLLGVIAFFMDRMLLSDSTTAPSKAVASPVYRRTTPVAKETVSENASISIPALAFPRNILTYDPRFSMRDIFSPYPKWQHEQSSLHSTDKARSDIEKNMRLSRSVIFMTQHKLNAILNGPDLKIAIIDGHWVRVGDTFDGCKLRKLEGEKIYFTCSDGEAVLNLVITDVTFPD